MVAALATSPNEVTVETRGAGAALFSRRDRELLIVGPAGTGKTVACLWKLHLAALKYRGMRAMMVRKTGTALAASALVSFQSHVLGSGNFAVRFFGGSKIKPAQFEYPNGSVIVVGGLDNPDKIMSAEYDLAYCFVGETRIESPSPIEKAYSREYSGPLVTIRTATGNELTGTPNHPILTDQGWVALNLIKEGDYVVSRCAVKDERAGGNPDIENQPATIAEITRALAFADSSHTQRIEAVGMNFHGDGVGGDVDVVTTARGLHRRRKPVQFEPIVQLDSLGRNLQETTLVGEGALGEVFITVDLTGLAEGRSSAQLPEPFAVGVGLNPTRTHFDTRVPKLPRPFSIGVTDVPVLGGVAMRTRSNTSPPHLSFERGVADADGAGNRHQPAFAGEIALDRVVHIERADQRLGVIRHVYNLQTSHHYYFANNIIAHNCNEATELTEADWESITSRLRYGVMPYQQLLADCNPGAPSHWLKRRCDTGKTAALQSRHEDNPRYFDGIDWTTEGRAYIEDVLDKLSGHRYQRLRLGKWVAAEGLVYPGFTHEQIQTVDCTGWATALALDLGTRNPTCILTIKHSGDRLHIADEFYRTGLGSEEIEAEAERRYRAENAEWIVVDPSAAGLIVTLERKGLATRKAVNEVVVGISRVTGALADITVDPRCVNLLSEFDTYAYPTGQKTERDVPIKANDHAMDALRYGVMELVQPPEPSWTDVPSDWINAWARGA